MFVLFKAMNGDTESLLPLFHALPLSKLGFVVYMVVSSWAILSILTAVVSENMIKANEQRRNELDEEREYTKVNEVREYLAQLFADADRDKNNYIGPEEFKSMMDDASTSSDLTEKTGLQRKDLEQIFTFMLDRSGRVSREVFIAALQNESRIVTERSVFRLEKRLLDLQLSFEEHMLRADEHREEKKADKSHIVQLIQGAHDNLLSKLQKGHGKSASKLLSAADPLQSDADKEQDVPRKPAASVFTGSAFTMDAAVPSKDRTDRTDGRNDLEEQLLPFQIALQIIEHRLDSVALISNSQQCDRSELTRIAQREASCEALLGKLEENLGVSKHNVRFGLQSIVTKIQLQSKITQQTCNAEPLIQQIEKQLQEHHQSALESLTASIERKMDMSQTWRQVQSEFTCLMGKYEMRLQMEMNRGVAAAHDLSSTIQSATTFNHDYPSAHGSPVPAMTGLQLQGSSPAPFASSYFDSPTKVSAPASSSQVLIRNASRENTGFARPGFESLEVPGFAAIATGATGGTLE